MSDYAVPSEPRGVEPPPARDDAEREHLVEKISDMVTRYGDYYLVPLMLESQGNRAIYSALLNLEQRAKNAEALLEERSS